MARYVHQQWNISVNPATGWKWLKRLGFSLQVPRPSHPQRATPPQRRSWKDVLRRRVRGLRRRHRNKIVAVWAEDEARLGLQPIARRIWARRGQRPKSYG